MCKMYVKPWFLTSKDRMLFLILSLFIHKYIFSYFISHWCDCALIISSPIMGEGGTLHPKQNEMAKHIMGRCEGRSLLALYTHSLGEEDVPGHAGPHEVRTWEQSEPRGAMGGRLRSSKRVGCLLVPTEDVMGLIE